MKKQILDGNAAAAEAIRASNVEVVAMYPITPQSPLAEKLSAMIAKGQMNSTCTCVESEHSAISYVIGSQLTGVRSTTATSSVGLALMHEVLGVAAGCHVPIVMPVVNRALVSPWSLWCDHQDTMCERDTGWMQVYAENAQEVYDLIICAYKVAENRDVCLPMMVCMDGFYVSHTLQTVITESDDEVSEFVGRYQPTNLKLDNSSPMFINNLTSPDEYTEMRYQQKVSFDNAKEVMAEVFDEFKGKFGREYSLTEAYCCDDAEAVIVCLGSACGTIKHMIQVMRKEGYKVGLLKIISYRPFPAEEVSSKLKGIKKIGILDRSSGLGGNFGPLGLDVTQAVSSNGAVNLVDFVSGLGGRDVSEDTIRKMFMTLLDNDAENKQIWIDVHDNALEIRERNTCLEGRA